jgi:hypothetical protein
VGRIAALALAFVSAASLLTAAEPAVRILKGANQQTVYASAFPQPLVVWVTDPVAQQPLPGVQVTFTAGSGIGLSATVVTTDERGLAAVTATGLAACVSTVSAEVAGFPASRVQFDNLVINKAILTVVPVDLENRAGDQVPRISEYSIRGFVNGDSEATAQITGTPVLSTTARDNSPRANYAIKGGVGSLAAPNYTFVAGFGTLAVTSKPGSVSEHAPTAEAALEVSLRREAAEVRPALMNKPSAISLNEPAFLAGLHGESGVFVQTAIWQGVSKPSSAVLAAPVRNAIPAKVAAVPANAPTAPVRPAVINKSASPTSASKLSSASVRAAGLKNAPTAPAEPASSGSVRAVVLNNAPAGAGTLPSSYAGSSIRKAFNPPGTN